MCFFWLFLILTSLPSISDCNAASPDGYDAGCTACSATVCTHCGDGYVLKTDGTSCIGEHFLLFN